jgi:uncharacterized membrane protein YedE/YeeE
MKFTQFSQLDDKSEKYMNPYLAGILLGLTLLVAVYISGRGLGASGAFKSVIVTTVENVAPSYAEGSQFYQDYTKSHGGGSPMKSWLVFEILGVIIGGFASGLISGRMKLRTEKGPSITNKTRLIAALIGGAFFGYGATLGRGCTSGAALSGMAVLSLHGFIVMLAIFGTAYVLAYFVRKLWL